MPWLKRNPSYTSGNAIHPKACKHAAITGLNNEAQRKEGPARLGAQEIEIGEAQETGAAFSRNLHNLSGREESADSLRRR